MISFIGTKLPTRTFYQPLLFRHRLLQPFNLTKRTFVRDPAFFRPGNVPYTSTTPRGRAVRLVGGLAVVGFGLSISTLPTVYCDRNARLGVPPAPQPSDLTEDSNKDFPPESTVSTMQLTFGTVTGICAGIFIKKGAKAVAWFLGGIFVLLQYLGSVGVAKINWNTVASKYERLFYTTDANGIRIAPTIVSLWRGLIDFLTADFQPRASFVAGMLLGLRLG